MTVLEKITLQKQNPLKAILFKEGIFYKAYNEGAFLLRSKNYKVAVKAYKKIDQQVLSIGFPASVFDKLKTEFVVEIFETYNSFATTENYNTLDYTNWKPPRAGGLVLRSKYLVLSIKRNEYREKSQD